MLERQPTLLNRSDVMDTSVFTEGKVEILAPAGKPTKALSVFYNPEMKFDRDLTIEVLRNLKFERYCDALAGTGVRAIRVAKELGKEAFANDKNPNAAKLIEKNAKRNKAGVEASCCDANIFLTNHKCDKFDVIDIDPFGAFIYYLDSALKSVRRKHGMLCLTSTDLAPLCGTSPRACMRKYGAKPLRVSYKKELGLRILLASSNLLAAKYEIALEPMLSYYRGHYFRIFARTERGPVKVDNQLKRIRHLQHCPRCEFRAYVDVGAFLERCSNCGNERLEWAGPLWDSALADPKFCAKLDSGVAKTVAQETVNLPYYETHSLAKAKKTATPKMQAIIDALKSKSHEVNRTHFSDSGVRTDAPVSDIYRVF